MVVPFPEGTLRRTRERTARLAGAPDRSGFQAELHLDAGLVSRSLGSTRGGGPGGRHFYHVSVKKLSLLGLCDRLYLV